MDGEGTRLGLTGGPSLRHQGFGKGNCAGIGFHLFVFALRTQPSPRLRPVAYFRIPAA